MKIWGKLFKEKISWLEAADIITQTIHNDALDLRNEMYPSISSSKKLITKELNLDFYLEIYAAILFPCDHGLKIIVKNTEIAKKISQCVFDNMVYLIMDIYNEEKAKLFSAELIDKINEYRYIFELEIASNIESCGINIETNMTQGLLNVAWEVCLNLGLIEENSEPLNPFVIKYSNYCSNFFKFIYNIENKYNII
jgi:hypothetical protein